MFDLKHFEDLRTEAQSLLDAAAALKATIAPKLVVIYSKHEALQQEVDEEAAKFFKSTGLWGFMSPATVGVLYNMGWNNGRGASGWSQTLSRELANYDSNVRSTMGGWRPAQDEQAVFGWTVALPQTRNLDEAKLQRTIVFLQGVCKAHEIFEGDFVVNVFEHTLSKYGFYYLVFDREEGAWTVSRSTYSVMNEGDGMTLEVALRQISRDHWYE